MDVGEQFKQTSQGKLLKQLAEAIHYHWNLTPCVWVRRRLDSDSKTDIIDSCYRHTIWLPRVKASVPL